MDSILNVLSQSPTKYKINSNLLKRYMTDFMLFSDVDANYSGFGLNKINSKDFKIAKEIYYKTNSHGFRCEELKNTEILFAGCSITYGIGIQEDAIWGNLVAKSLGNNAINISSPGAGVDRIVKMILSYLQNFKAETIFCLFPGFGRMLFPVSNKLVSFKTGKPITNDSFEMQTIFLEHYKDMFDRPKFDKRPYSVENTIPYELSFINSIEKIMFLDMYCKARGIKFYWGTWDKTLNHSINVYNKNNNVYNNFVFTDVENWVINENSDEKYLNDISIISDFESIKDTCHLDIKVKFPNTFYAGLDIEDITDNKAQRPHPGSHFHAHIADSFINFLKK